MQKRSNFTQAICFYLLMAPCMALGNNLIFEKEGNHFSLLEDGSLRVDGDNLYYGTLVQFKNPIDTGGFKSKSIISYTLVNCNNYEGSVTNIKSFSNADGTGQVHLDERHDTANPKIFMPGTIAYKTADFACRAARDRGLFTSTKTGPDEDIRIALQGTLRQKIKKIQIKEDDVSKFNDLHIGASFLPIEGLPYRIKSNEIVCDIDKNANLDRDAVVKGTCGIKMFGKETNVTVTFFQDEGNKFVPIVLSVGLLNPDMQVVKSAIHERWGKPVSITKPGSAKNGNKVCDLIYSNKSLAGRFDNFDCKDDLNNNPIFELANPDVAIEKFKKSGATLYLSKQIPRSTGLFSLNQVEISITRDDIQKVISESIKLEKSLRSNKAEALRKNKSSEF